MARFLSCFLSRSRNSLCHRGQSGQVVMIAGLLLPLLLGMAGLAVDVGIAASGRRDTQNAADAAALAGAGILHDGGSATAARTAARSWAQKNGYPDAETTVNIPPQSGAHTGDSSYVEVVITHQRSTLFMRALHVNNITSSSRAVARHSRVKSYAMIVLNPTKCSAYNQSSGSVLTLNGGGLIVDSSCKPSGSQGGGSTVNAGFIDYYQAGSWDQSNNASSSVVPSAVPAPLPDPLASLARPLPGTASPDSGGTAASPKQLNLSGSGDVTLHPGTYYGGIKIGVSGTLTFAPGIYILAGGGLDYTSSANIVGNDVVFFNTNDPYAAKKGAGDCGGFSISGTGTLSLAGATSGAYKDMLFWQDDACTVAMTQAGKKYTNTGIIYLPKAQLTVSGGGYLGALQIVVDSFQYTGSTEVVVDTGNYIDAGPISLVE